MDEKPSDSSWDDLLKQIGAAPSPDALERRRPAIETPVEPPPKLPAPRKQKAGDWNALGSQLGLEPSAEEPAEPPRRREEPVEPPRRREAPAEPRRREPPARSSSPPPVASDVEAGFATIEPMESQFEEIMEEELTDVEFAEQDDSDLLDEGLPETADEPEGLSGDAARTAFEALFSAGSFSALSEPPAPPKRREFRRDEPPRDLDAPARPPRRESSRDTGRDRDGERGEDEARGDDDDRGDRPRRRRRRGRGRGGREREDSATPGRDDQAREWSDEPAGDEDRGDGGEGHGERESDSDRGDRPRRRRSRRGRGSSRTAAGDERQATGGDGRPAAYREQAVDAAMDEDDDDAGVESGFADDAEDEGGDGDRSHKGIPSWGEAIGVMVEANIQARKNSPQRGPSRGQDRDRGRGRGRGGRGGRGGRSGRGGQERS